VLSLVYLAESLSLHDVAEYWKAVVSLNEQQKQRFSTRVVACLFNTMKGKKIAVLGFAYKKDTGDARESPAITLVRDFVAEGAKVSMFDPKVPLATVQNELLAAGVSPMKLKSSITFEPNPYDACAQADAVVLVTEWDMFSNKLETVQPHSQETRPVGNVHHSTQEAGVESAPFHEDGDTTNADADNKQRLATNGSSNGAIHIAGTHGSSVNSIPRLDWSFIAANMRKPKFVFDGRNILDVDKLKDLGFVVESIGKSSLRHR
jgi:UDPglucose 6-dehydrogenase